MKISKISLLTFFHNVYNLFVYDYHRSDIERKQQWVELRDYVTVEAMNKYFSEINSEPYKDEVEYVYRYGFNTFPYKKLKRLESVECGFERRFGMYFVFHNGKKLFFPKDVSVEKAECLYRHYIETENLLGGNYTKKMPHCYQSKQVKVDEGDIFIDVGAAEGLMALDVIDRVSKVYVVEPNLNWVKALRATFEPYKEKCVILPKLVTNYNGRKAITLERLLEKEKNHHIFVKMDIEGFEKRVLDYTKNYLSQHENIKLACCTYHFKEDAQVLSELFEQIGYHYEFSDGWMLFANYEKSLQNPPFFRHGIIRAWK